MPKSSLFFAKIISAELLNFHTRIFHCLFAALYSKCLQVMFTKIICSCYVGNVKSFRQRLLSEFLKSNNYSSCT